MILSGRAIADGVAAGDIVIEPFDPANLEPNSYGVHLGDQILSYLDPVLRPDVAPTVATQTVGPAGIVLRPGRCYLGSTLEKVGSHRHAATLYASRSVSTMGLWIQFSAPLGHSGAIIAWTLELKAALPIRLYRRMPIGKVAFWTIDGAPMAYSGRYAGSAVSIPSRLWQDHMSDAEREQQYE